MTVQGNVENAGNRRIIFDGKTVADDSDCYVIAEIGNNHQGDVELGKRLIDAALLCSCDAVKFQKRNNRLLFTKEMFDSPYNSENAFAATYGLHREAVELTIDQLKQLQEHAHNRGITFFATAFDRSSADQLFELNPPMYKIASADLTNTPLLRHVAEFGKPMIISTGGGTIEDVDRAYETVAAVNSQICIMQCTSSYPAKIEELNLRVIGTFRDRYPSSVIGYSGHDNGIAMPVVAYMLGARVVEKHITLDRTMKGTDHVFSLTTDGLRKMVRDLRRTKIALGDGDKRCYDSEVLPMRKMAKKLVAAHDLPVGHQLVPADILAKVPNDGLPPYELESLVGRRLRVALREDDNLSFEILE